MGKGAHVDRFEVADPDPSKRPVAGGLYACTDHGVIEFVDDPSLPGSSAASSTWATWYGGSLTQGYVGKNAVGASWEAMTSRRVYAKKVTLANACLVTNIEAYVDGATAESKVDNLSVAIYSDNAGIPDSILAYNVNPTSSVALDDTNGAGGNNVGRWLGVPIGKWLTAGDYWIAVASLDAATEGQRIAYDTGGTDRFYLPGGDWFVDWGFNTPTTGTKDYSIRANTIR